MWVNACVCLSVCLMFIFLVFFYFRNSFGSIVYSLTCYHEEKAHTHTHTYYVYLCRNFIFLHMCILFVGCHPSNYLYLSFRYVLLALFYLTLSQHSKFIRKFWTYKMCFQWNKVHAPACNEIKKSSPFFVFFLFNTAFTVYGYGRFGFQFSFGSTSETFVFLKKKAYTQRESERMREIELHCSMMRSKNLTCLRI